MAKPEDARSHSRWEYLQEIADRVDRAAKVDTQGRVVLSDKPEKKMQGLKDRAKRWAAVLTSGAILTTTLGGISVANTLDCTAQRAVVVQQAKEAPEHVRNELRNDPDGSSLYRPYQLFCDAEQMRIVAEKTLAETEK